MTNYEYFRNKLHEITSLKDGTDVEGTISSISNGLHVKGANVWILICAALLASIGLDTNSTAVIIGAMLISPLMSPILGIGLSVGISDKDLLILSVRQFIIAVAASLAASTLYFIFTPLGQPTAEMIARTKPTLLDVGVAMFGGIAGIVASSRLEKTNAIPGVAIATALMPPLCTAGFGIARGEWEFFFGAFYLFFINAVFISLSTYLVVRFLKFPSVNFIDLITKRRIQRSIAIFAIIVILPSMYIFWNVIHEARFNRNVQLFIDKHLKNEKFEAIRWDLSENDSIKILKFYVIGEQIDDDTIQIIQSRLKDFDIKDYEVKMIQMNVADSEVSQIKKEVAGEVALTVLNQVQMAKSTRDSIAKIVDKFRISQSKYNDIKSEIMTFFPEISDLKLGFLSDYNSDSTLTPKPVAILNFIGKLNPTRKSEIITKTNDFLKLKFKSEEVLVIEK